MKKKWCVIGILLLCMMLCGCDSVGGYESMRNNLNSFYETYRPGVEVPQGNFVEQLYTGFEKARVIGVIIALVSILIGILIMALVKKEKKFRQKALLVFIIAIPISTLGFIYGGAFLLDWFTAQTGQITQ